MRPRDSSNKSWRRRDLIKLFGATAIAGPAIFQRTMARAATSKVIKIGHVGSPTGVFAPFAQADPFILDQIRTALGKGISVTAEWATRSKSSARIANRVQPELRKSLLT